MRLPYRPRAAEVCRQIFVHEFRVEWRVKLVASVELVVHPPFNENAILLPIVLPEVK